MNSETKQKLFNHFAENHNVLLMEDDYNQIKNLVGKDEFRTCKNCASYDPVSDYDRMLLEEKDITLCMGNHPDWGCNDFKNKIEEKK